MGGDGSISPPPGTNRVYPPGFQWVLRALRGRGWPLIAPPHYFLFWALTAVVYMGCCFCTTRASCPPLRFGLLFVCDPFLQWTLDLHVYVSYHRRKVRNTQQNETKTSHGSEGAYKYRYLFFVFSLHANIVFLQLQEWSHRSSSLSHEGTSARVGSSTPIPNINAIPRHVGDLHPACRPERLTSWFTGCYNRNVL